MRQSYVYCIFGLFFNCVVSTGILEYAAERRRGDGRKRIEPEVLPCIADITKKDVNTKSILLAQEIRQISNSKILITSVEATVMILEDDNFRNRSGHFVIFPAESNKSYRKILNAILPSDNNRFLIVWPHFFVNAAPILKFLIQFWEFRIINVLIVVRRTANTYNTYTYNPYTSTKCNKPASLSMIDEWNVASRNFMHNSTLHAISRQLTNLHGCKLICFAKTRPPDSIVVKDSEGNWILEGIGGELFEEIRKRINFTPVIEVAKLNVTSDKYGYDISEGYPDLISRLLRNFSVDLGFGIYSHIIYDNPSLEFSIPLVPECFGWAVPAHSGKIIPLWKYYTEEFRFTVWLLIILIFTVNVFIFHFTTRRSLNSSTLYVFALHLGAPTTPKLKRTIVRIFSSSMLLYFLIVSTAYQSSLGSFLTVPWPRENINSFVEILDADYQVAGVPQAKRILQRFSANDSVLRKLSGRFTVYRDHFGVLVKRIQQEKDVVTFGAQRFIQFYVTNELNGTARKDIYLLPKCVIQAHASPFLFRRGSPLMKPINRIIASAAKSGLAAFWFKISTPEISRSFTPMSPLSMQQLRCAFVVLLLGSTLAVVVFLYELKQRKSRGETAKNRKEVITAICYE